MNGADFGYALLVGILPALVWLFFWLHEDKQSPEPRSLLSGCFIAGMIAVLVAIPTEQYVAGIVTNEWMKYSLWALIEEGLKFIAIAMVALKTRFNDEPIDAMIYCIAGALGFAALENTLFTVGALSDGNLIAGIVTGNMRSIGASLVHVVSSAFVGFALSLTFYRRNTIKLVGWILGISAAVSVHAAFNLSIIASTSKSTLQIFGLVWAAVVLLIILFEEVKVVRPALN